MSYPKTLITGLSMHNHHGDMFYMISYYFGYFGSENGIVRDRKTLNTLEKKKRKKKEKRGKLE